MATVRYQGQELELPRRKSGIGIRYASPEATLIIDDEMAVLVTETNVNLKLCRVQHG